MTILLTGGTGKTGSKIAQLLHASNHSFLIATRSGVAPEPFKAIKFDWHNPETFGNPFANQSIDCVYLVIPAAVEPLPIVKPFIELAVTKGVKRFVALAATSPLHGSVPEYLATSGLDYTILRPTWFMDNFATLFYASIRKRNEVFSVAEDGRIPWVAAEDIAKAAYDALTAKESPNTDYNLLGPELYSYDEAAALLSEVLGRKITHKRLAEEQFLALGDSIGLPKDFSELLYTAEVGAGKGSEEALVGNSKTITGKKKLLDYIEEHKETWLGETADSSLNFNYH